MTSKHDRTSYGEDSRGGFHAGQIIRERRFAKSDCGKGARSRHQRETDPRMREQDVRALRRARGACEDLAAISSGSPRLCSEPHAPDPREELDDHVRLSIAIAMPVAGFLGARARRSWHSAGCVLQAVRPRLSS